MGITLKELLINHLDRTFKEGHLSPSLSMAVHRLAVVQAAWKPSADRHSIWQIVRHVTHWKQGAISALDGNPRDYDELNRADWQEVADDQRAWEADVERLRTVTREIRSRLEAMDEQGLARSIKWYQQSPEPWPIGVRLLDLATHDTYHAGQIQYIFALQEIPVEEFAMAASRDDVGRLDRLLQKDKSVIKDYSRDGWTALHVACFFSQKEAVHFLVTCGASVNAASKNDKENTPLHSAVIGVGNRKEIVKLLLQHGADIAVRNAKGNTPLDLAQQEADTGTVEILRREAHD